MQITKYINDFINLKASSTLSDFVAVPVCEPSLDDITEESSKIASALFGGLIAVSMARNVKNFLNNKNSIFDENLESRFKSRQKYIFKINNERLKRISMYRKPSSKKCYQKRYFTIEQIKVRPC